MKLWRLILRMLVGGLFVGHGTQKLFGWFGGHGLEGTAGMFESLGLKPGRRNAIAAGVAEAGGGALLVTGLATPLAGAAIGGTMVTAIRYVHAPKGPWVTNGGWEYNAVLLGTTCVLVESGPGPLSLDYLLGTESWGTYWALGALGAGVAGSFIASKLAQRAEDREFEPVPFEPAEEREPAEGTVAASADGS